MFRIALVLFLAAGIAPAAPVPTPRPLATDLLLGRWEYRWGTLPVGWIEFREDGRYFSAHRQVEWPEFMGHWWVRGDVLTIQEGRCPCLDDLTAPTCLSCYEIKLSTSDYPTIAGTSYGTRVSFAKGQP